GPLLPYGASHGIVPLARDLDTIGPMGRTTEDLIVLHEAIVGRAVPRANGIAGKRLGVAWLQHWANLDPEVEAVCTNALARLEDAGAAIVDSAWMSLSGRFAARMFAISWRTHCAKSYRHRTSNTRGTAVERRSWVDTLSFSPSTGWMASSFPPSRSCLPS